MLIWDFAKPTSAEIVRATSPDCDEVVDNVYMYVDHNSNRGPVVRVIHMQRRHAEDFLYIRIAIRSDVCATCGTVLPVILEIDRANSLWIRNWHTESMVAHGILYPNKYVSFVDHNAKLFIT